jgi:phospholipid-translocating ATPase
MANNISSGDKLQTAIEIGFSCNLLKSDMDLMILSADSLEQTRAQIEAGLNKIASVLGPPSWDVRKRGFVPGAQASFAVVIDGDTLRHALTPELKELFLNLGTQCETVVCCRVSPAQKALTVKLVRRSIHFHKGVDLIFVTFAGERWPICNDAFYW